MEQAVNNPEIDRVLMICDKSYTDKANNREGGVGDETVIISLEIYENARQEKFIPIIFEKDENNKPYQPSYLKTTIEIIVHRELKPVLFKKKIVNADIFLYQMSVILKTDTIWFPLSYVYWDNFEKQQLWQKLVSRE